ncbi:glycerol-3-phosphate acyltransferase 3-like isoform X1 [Phlebotomus papatasi]|uniref:glycerol-3-phosphate acyltransferase 3-like isoform X1 n=1 Tax=Phlebotomus papatasi TaxID=29031 RepID=UPI0024846BB9|nr:glycerol-3-phosphate acyltransferase 3-like isoform X1 [Phlebotomus papatasi]
MTFIQVMCGVGSSLMVTPVLMFILCIIFVGSLGKSFGIRRLYVNFLLKIFEYGRVNIETAKKSRYAEVGATETDDDSSATPQIPIAEKVMANGNGFLGKTQSNGNHLISRDPLILAPDAEYQSTKKELQRKISSSDGEISDEFNPENEEKNFEFNLENCLDYVKAGMEAIIEDDVTSRFEAEELKNWNLLTRTNRHYEFISWRLTVIWMCGFFVRYAVLMPLRVLICFFGVAWAVISFAIIGCIPMRRLRRHLNDEAFKITFRLISNSISAVITFHNPEYRPRNCGFCVANHTSPIDISILSTDCTYSLVMWLVVCTALVGSLPDNEFKRWTVPPILRHCFSILASSVSTVITYHNEENRPVNGICVANHTSPIDALVLMHDNCYSLIGQRHGGFLGVLQRALARASPHIWFERAEAKDRLAVAQRLRHHVSNPRNPPILIFPEGTCINNTSVMQFKKGSFEVGGVIYPVAIKYDARFGDAFWNSSRYSMMQYLYMMMTSWAIVCDVWYLPPMFRQEGESAIDFANRVKSVIAKQGGLVDLMWDGQLKRMKPKKEWREKQQEEFTKRLKGE